MNTRAWYRAAALDPGAPVPEALTALLDTPADELPVLVLLAGPSVRTTGWAAEAALRLSREIAKRGREVVLVDGCVAEPVLRGTLGAGSGEGLTDVLLYGATIEHAAQPLEERLSYLPTGPAVPEPEAVLDHADWERVIRRARAAGRTLVVIVPGATAGADRLSVRAGTVVLLTAGAEAERLLKELPPQASVAAVLTPPGAEAVLPPPDGERIGQGAAVAGGEAEAGQEAAVALAEARGGGETGPDLEVPPAADRAERRRSPWPVAGVVLALILILVAWLLWRGSGRSVSGAGGSLDSGDGSGADPAGGAALAAGPRRPRTGGDEPLAYSVAIESHPDVQTAMARALELRDSLGPGVRFFVSPIRLDSVVYYRLLAGPAPDSASADALMRRLVEAGIKSGADDWSVRPTPWAFQLAEFASADSAEEQQQALNRRHVPTYVIEVADSAGGSRYRIYSGAFEGPALSEVLGTLLREAGVQSNLVRRTGYTPE